MPRRHGPALLTALVVGTAALAAIVALAGSLLFSGGGAKQVGTESVARTPAAAKPTPPVSGSAPGPGPRRPV